MFLILLKIPVLQLLLTLPFTHIILKSFLVALVLYGTKKLIVMNNKGNVLAVGILFLAAGVYFGVLPATFFSLLFVSSYILGKRLGLQSGVLSFLFGFFVLMMVYILVGLILNLTIAVVLLAIISFCMFFLHIKDTSKRLALWKDVTTYIRSFNVMDLWILVACFVIGSFPQVHWDSLYANLYNAKWYALLNGFPVLEESISSLFAQNAIAYYSLFFKVGVFKGFQIAFLLPLFSFIALLKFVIEKMQIKNILRYSIYLFLFAPIIFFQSSTGYYDVLITVLVFAACASLLFEESTKQIKYIASALFIGFAAGIRQFALVFWLLPICAYLYENYKQKIRLLLIALLVLCSMFPLGIWSVRTYMYTGSPVFPFFQNIFPTPQMWSSGALENNFMIQTTMTVKQWFMGGWIAYPFISYFRSEYYMEATRGYPTVIYIFTMVLVLFFLGRTLYLVIRKKKIGLLELLHIYLFLSYIAVGAFTRYYRYLFPFLFLVCFSSFLLFVKHRKELQRRIGNVLLLAGLVLIFVINLFDIFESFRFYAMNPVDMFHPERHLTSQQNTTGEINALVTDKPILDASQYLLPRLYVNTRVYECNWYWISGDTIIAYASKDPQELKNVLHKFSLVVSSIPQYKEGYCGKIAFEAVGFEQVYKDSMYTVQRITK